MIGVYENTFRAKGPKACFIRDFRYIWGGGGGGGGGGEVAAVNRIIIGIIIFIHTPCNQCSRNVPK